MGLLTSFVIEAAQGTGLFGIYPYAYRTADVNDLMYNTAGAALGWWAAALLGRILPPGALADEDEVTHEPGFIRRCVAFWLDTTLVGIVASTVAGALTLLANNVPGLAWLSTLFEEGRLALWISAIAFVLVEGVLPWFHEGSTPGGGFVRMSCETRERTGARRVVFYAVRLAVLAAAFVYFPFAWPVLGLFYLVACRMPYDFL